MNTAQNLYDLIIIGSGSAGLSAGIYAGRAKLKTLILDRDRVGGQIKITAEVDNYPGILQISGDELSQTMRKQAERFGVKFQQAVVESVDFTRDIKIIKTVDGEYHTLAVILATGATPRKLGFTGEDTYRGRGIGYCATCDGEFFSGLDVFVVGAGFAAAEEAIFLTRYAKKVTVIAREPKFTCSQMIGDRVLAHPGIEVKFNTELLEVGGDTVLRYARFIDNATGETWRYDVPEPGTTFGVFVFVGYQPQSAEYANQIRLDEQRYIPTDESMRTNVDGVYAAGDIRPKELRQLVTAVSDGAIASTNAEKYIEQKKRRLGIVTPEQPPQAEIPDSKTSGSETSVSQTSVSQTSYFENSFFDDALRQQLTPILERLESNISLLAILDDGGDSINAELRAFLSEFATVTNKVEILFLKKGEDAAKEQAVHASFFPTVALLRTDGSYTGVQFHGIPTGHEINSFILAIYNAAGPGQTISEDTRVKIRALDKQTNFKIGVSLSCTLCPDVVAAAQLIAIQNPLIEAEMIDIARFPAFKNKHAIMSVPAVLVNDDKLVFGKKSLDDLLALA